MKLKEYIADKVINILIYNILIISILFFLIMFRVPPSLITIVVILMIVFLVIIITYDYYRKKTFYKEFAEKLSCLDRKCLISELVEKPDFIEGKIFYEFLYEINKSMYEEIEEYKINVNDFKEYIEMWIHEVKLPIASTTLILYNNKPNSNKKIKEQINRIENYVEQVLYFVRSENAEKDYLIKKCKLVDIINSVVRKNKDSLLLKHIGIDIIDINNVVLSDRKWIEFIVNQIISNSIKYCKEDGARIIFRSKVVKDLIILEIEDNGIGINEKEISNVFNKSFTGENGREKSSSTGMGLYLVKKLCDKLGHDIKIDSKKNKFTKVSISFKDDKYYNDVR